MRVFLDTNVLVSAFATRGLCSDILEVVLLEHDLVIGSQVLHELNRALRSKLKLSASHTKEIADFMSDEAAQFVDSAEPAAAKASPEDARVLGEALAGGATILITGDAALLKLGAIEQTQIVSPRRFWEILQAHKA